MRAPSPVRRYLAILVGLGLVGGCLVDESGLGRARDGGATATGAAGSSGQAGTGGPGVAGTSASMGVAGEGVAGTGAAGTTAAAGTGAAGTSAAAGTTGAAGTIAAAAGTTGAAGTTAAAGTTGAAGTMGMTGVAGSMGAAGRPGCGACPACFRCVNDACEPDQNAAWTVSCGSAVIAPLKPTGADWDSTSQSPPGTWPDTICQLLLEDGRTRSTSLVTDSLMPVWNASVTPTSGSPLTARALTSPQTHWRITLFDEDASEDDPVCSTLPVPTAADLAKGSLTLMNVGSCTKLTLGFACASGGGPGPSQ